MAALAALGAVVCLLFQAAPSSKDYGRILWGLAGFLFYPFGKFVRLEKDEHTRMKTELRVEASPSTSNGRAAI